MLYLVGRCSQRADTIRQKVQIYLFWNGSIRLFMEAFLDFALFSMLNISQIQWIAGLASVEASNVLSYIIFTLCALVPIILCVFAFCKRKNLSDEQFTETYGAFLDGTNNDDPANAISAIIIAFVFFFRRFVLCLTLVYWP